MKKYIILYLLLYTLSAFQNNLSLPNADKDSDKIVWEQNVKLKWKDFKGAPLKFSPLDAMTECDIKVYYETDSKNQLKVNVSNYFDKKLSWTKDTASKALLNHEQLHFDICEVYTRLARKRCGAYKKTDPGTVKKLNAEIEKILNEWSKEEEKYDTETKHGLIREKQKLWEEKVNKLLLELKPYSKN